TAITAQPKSVTQAAGTTAKFTVTATGVDLNYQWQVYTSGAWKDSSAEGNKTATLSVAVIAARNGQKYRCVVTGANSSVTSSAATLTVS
ncbi:MAG: immunoglobulin domain-containing protein, partial [Oscillospiraceae bacterium]|nr:immunoglobulin domain-containing protein [Oscillospiraceae bacterium]